jgi:hypothetical protein
VLAGWSNSTPNLEAVWPKELEFMLVNLSDTATMDRPTPGYSSGECRRGYLSFYSAMLSLFALAMFVIGVDVFLPVSGPDRFRTFAITSIPLTIASISAVAAIIFSIPLILNDRSAPLFWLVPLAVAAMLVEGHVHWWWLMTQRQQPPPNHQKVTGVATALAGAFAVSWVVMLVTTIRFTE